MRKISAASALFLTGAFLAGLAAGADFNGDGTNDVAVFRPGAGLWSVRDVTRVYLGSAGDEPVPGDYNGDGAADVAVFRPGGGMWAIRNVTRAYLGSAGDTPLGGYGGGGGFWRRHLDGVYYSNGNGTVAIGSYPGVARLTITSDSDISSPQLLLLENAVDYARLNFASYMWPNPPEAFAIAAKTDVDPAASRMHFYYSATGNLLSLTGQGKVGIGNENPSYFLTMEASGGGYYSSTDHSWHNGSSRAIKRDIALNDIDTASILEKLDVVKYRFKSEVARDEKAPYHIGFIAEDAPELLTGKDHNSMATGDCIGLLLAVVKEQGTTLQEQQKTISALEDKISKLEERWK